MIRCPIKLRISRMIRGAKLGKKRIPTREELSALLLARQADDMKCPACGQTMNWGDTSNRPATVSLQHDRSGTIRLICLRCNVRHQHYPADDFYTAPNDHKHCWGCGRTLALTEFWKSHTVSTHVCGQCKFCMAAKSAAYKKRNRAKLTKQEHERRLRKKKEHNNDGI